MLDKNTKQAVRRIRATVAALRNQVIGRTAMANQALYALLTGHHLLIEGTHGVAKSYFALKLLNAIEGARVFKIQCTRKMTEDAIVGPPNVKILRQEGRFWHNTEGTLAEADFAFVDEIMDLSSGALRSMLEILNERTFSRGAQILRCPLKTCIATTNFDREDEKELGAVYDRFLFRARAENLSRKQDRKAMLRAPDCELPTFSMKDLNQVKRRIKYVAENGIGDFVLDTLIQVADARGGISDRRLRQCLRVLAASAVLKGRNRVLISDIGSLDNAWVISGDKKSESEFGKAMQPMQRAVQIQKNKSALVTIGARVSSLRGAMSLETTYTKAVQDMAVEAHTAMNAIEHYKCREAEVLWSQAKAAAAEVLEMADKLYEAK